MKFSKAFDIADADAQDWFDVDLAVDTKLWIDPVQMIGLGGEWATAHDELVNHFVRCYHWVAKASSPTSISAQRARRMLTFPEPEEFCLGYTVSGTNGAGSGSVFAQRMMDGIKVAIAVGLDDPEHIEEIGLLNEGIGTDRISDAACNVLKSRFIRYTQDIARRNGLPMERVRVRNARCEPDNGRWISETVELPVRPDTKTPILLAPEALLNDLPDLNPDNFFDSDLNSDIRLQMNVQVGARVPKSKIVEIARRHPDRVRKWAQDQSSRPDLHGYDLSADPKGVVQWAGAPADYATSHPISAQKPTDQESLNNLVDAVVVMFKRFIEEQRGWSLLWNSDHTEKPEDAVQLAFMGMAREYLRLFDVEVDREVELGRGPVDFKISSGSALRVLIEVKKIHNGRFWNGLNAQLPSYLTSDDCNDGWFVAIRYRESKSSTMRVDALPESVAAVASETKKSLRFVAIDARRKVSASKLP